MVYSERSGAYGVLKRHVGVGNPQSDYGGETMSERNGNTDTRRPKMVAQATQTFDMDAFPYPSPNEMRDLLSKLLTEQIKTNLLLAKIEKLLVDGA
jgi:hypothetical protein